MSELLFQLKLAVKSFQRDLRQISLKEIAGMMGSDMLHIMGYGMVASFLTAVVRIFGFDTLIPFWFFTVVAAYFTYKVKASKLKTGTGGTLNSAKIIISVIALVAFVGAVFKFDDIESEYFDSRSKPFEDFNQDQFMKAFSRLMFDYQTRSCGHIALYLIYFLLFGVVSAGKSKDQTIAEEKSERKGIGKKERKTDGIL